MTQYFCQYSVCLWKLWYFFQETLLNRRCQNNRTYLKHNSVLTVTIDQFLCFCGWGLSGGWKWQFYGSCLWKPWNKKIIKSGFEFIFPKFWLFSCYSEIISHNSDKKNLLVILSFALGSESWVYIPQFWLFFAPNWQTLNCSLRPSGSLTQTLFHKHLQDPLLTVNILTFSLLLLYVQYPEQPVCTSLLFTLLFIKSQCTVFLFCTSYCFALFLFHCTFYSYFSFSYHMYALVLCYFI